MRPPPQILDIEPSYPNYSATTSTFCVQSGAQCNATNFAKRLECYKCSAPKSEYAIEVPRQVPDMTHNQSGHPSCILAVRSLPMEAQEEEVRPHPCSRCLVMSSCFRLQLTQLFMRYPGVKDIRLMRDRITGAPRGFGFVEFATVEHATAALQAIGSEFYYANALVRVSYSMDAATAPRSSESDVNALLASAAAAVSTSMTVHVPKKEFPLSFEQAGGSFVFVSEMYFNSYLGTYHVLDPVTKSSFLPFDIPLPLDDLVGAPDAPQTRAASAQKGKKKAVAISFGIKPSYVHNLMLKSIVHLSLCRRKFNSAAQLHKHEQLSDLHKQNLAKAKQTQQSLRVRDGPKETLLPRVEDPPDVPVDVARVDKPLDDQSNIGGKMLKMMGWKSGEGLGKAGTGITAPVAAVGKTSGDTSGLGRRCTLDD
ncbi:hypothetical protein DYB38_006758 [Aphanomyces astaci]|uniref:G-patch domain-containing protein n=1 Tax=Aphanomyces astaci TaxID=112090 RepID=A0A397D143_APHAT|nr:hypothetical protein DYB38_006758 [Aphanomyces astaci]